MEVSAWVFPRSRLDSSLDTNCLTSTGFEFFLARQVPEAQRYGYFFTLLLIRLESDLHRDKAFELAAMRLRRSDYVGRWDDRTMGIVLQYAPMGIAPKVVERLYSEVFSALSQGMRGVSFSSAVYPTEATTLPALKTLAAKRLISKGFLFSLVSGAKLPTKGTRGNLS